MTGAGAVPYNQRPVDDTALSTEDLPDTPVRDRNIPASAWREAPAALLSLGEDLGHAQVDYKRRIGPWLLWRSGPATKAHARYMALRADRLDEQYTFTLLPDGSGTGVGPDGVTYSRFREWKESLRDSA